MSLAPRALVVLALLGSAACGTRATQPTRDADPRGAQATQASAATAPPPDGAAAAPQQTSASAASPSAGAAVDGGVPATQQPRTAAVTPQATTPEAIARLELARLVREHQVRRAAIVVLDAPTGRILARAGVGPEGDALTLRALETGSTMKTLTVAAALDAGLDPAQRFTGEGGRWAVRGVTIRDVSTNDWLDARRVLVRSSNVGAAKVAERHLPAVLALQERLGWHTDLGLGAQSAGPAPQDWTGGQALLLAAGIGTRASPLHLASAYAALALDGTLRPPTADGTGAPVRVVSPATAAQVRAMLEAAVMEGTGRGAQVEGVRTAGKTGTLRTADGGTWGHFVGLAPADAPRWVVAVSVEVPGEGYSGGSIAAPAFARVVRALHAQR